MFLELIIHTELHHSEKIGQDLSKFVKVHVFQDITIRASAIIPDISILKPDLELSFFA